MIEKIFLFVQRQWAQIQSEGLRALHRKVKKARILLLMSVLAPLAVSLKIEWPPAYDFLVNKILKKIKRLRVRQGGSPLIDQLINKLIGYLQKYTWREPDLHQWPDWRQRSTLLGNLYIMNNDFKASLEICRKMGQVQGHIIKAYQLDDLGLEFVPRALPVGSIGVYEFLEMYLKARTLESGPNKKMILLMDPKSRITNPCYLKYWGKYLTVISDPGLIEMLAPLEKALLISCISFIQFRGHLSKSYVIQGTLREQWIQEGRQPFFTLSDEDYQRGWDCLRSLGLPPGAWFVTMHVREPGWRDSGSREENFRNADITTYIPAIKAITDAGGWVIRIGDPGMSKLPAMAKVIDYAHSSAKSDWMDIFLCAQCRFMIGTSSGMCVIAAAFGVPLVMTNLLPGYGVYHFTSRDLFIPRPCLFEDKKRYLNFRELISPPVGTASAQSHYDHCHLQIRANNAQEIQAVVEEMLERCAGTLQYSQEDQSLQQQFQEVTAQCAKLYGGLAMVAHARLGRQFLREHAELLLSQPMEACPVAE